MRLEVNRGCCDEGGGGELESRIGPPLLRGELSAEGDHAGIIGIDGIGFGEERFGLGAFAEAEVEVGAQDVGFDMLGIELEAGFEGGDGFSGLASEGEGVAEVEIGGAEVRFDADGLGEGR